VGALITKSVELGNCTFSNLLLQLLGPMDSFFSASRYKTLHCIDIVKMTKVAAFKRSSKG
jgi:hypothetical protein